MAQVSRSHSIALFEHLIRRCPCKCSLMDCLYEDSDAQIASDLKSNPLAISNHSGFESLRFQPRFLKVAHLQREFCTKDFFRATNFLMKNALKFSPKCLSLCSVGQKKSRKILAKFPTKFPPNFPSKNQKKFTDELLQERRENDSHPCSPRALPYLKYCGHSNLLRWLQKNYNGSITLRQGL